MSFFRRAPIFQRVVYDILNFGRTKNVESEISEKYEMLKTNEGEGEDVRMRVSVRVIQAPTFIFYLFPHF